MNWSPQQQNAIDLPVSNLIVSAAAGSGKTAVMAERILTRITGENYVDIDKILIVTYTSAAASEIKERIMKKIVEEMKKGNNDILHNQLIKLPYAHISTIHSFCLNLIKKYFYMLDIDPSVKIADETEVLLLKKTAINNVFDKHYNESDSEFIDFISTYSGKKDNLLCDDIVSLYDFSRTMPDSYDWVNNLDTLYKSSDNICTDFLMNTAKLAGKLALKIYESALEMCDKTDDTEKIKKVLSDEADILRLTLNSKSYSEMHNNLSLIKFPRWPSSKGDPWIVGKMHRKRDEAKKIIKEKILEKYITCSTDDIKKDNLQVLCYIQTYKQLVFEFAEEFEKLKHSKNLIDFSDFEHLTLKLLRDDSGNPTEIADKISEEFEEIYIDEYQDCNNIQNTIFNLISGQRRNNPNIFCVGDIKQSIYSFRDSNPLLFKEKCDKYELYDGKNLNSDNKILLNSNYRSRETILNFVNSLFRQIMSPVCGDINYDEDEYLYYGGGFENVNEDVNKIDISIIDENDNFNNGNEELASNSYTNTELEAIYIANKISKMVSEGYMLYDKKSKQKRDAQYKDFVILMRSVSNAAPVFEKIFSELSIPVYSDRGESYYDTEEINFLMSFMKIIDNPDDDIALVSVMKNPLFGFDENKLLKIRIKSPDSSFYEAIKQYDKNYNDDLSIQIHGFLEKLDILYLKSRYMNTADFLNYLVKKSDLYVYLSTFKDSQLRKTNVKFLLKKARDFEKSNFKGIGNFVRYIENTSSTTKAEGAKIINENDNVVRIMSIHKSKGLEFPIVFVSRLGKRFNKPFLRSAVSMHREFGIGIDCVYRNLGTKISTANKQAIKLKSDFESISEELRILYVALTRATEKLILTGTVENAPVLLNEIEAQVKDEPDNINPYLIYTSPFFLKMIMYGVVRSTGYPSNFDYFRKIDDKFTYNMNFINRSQIKKLDYKTIIRDWKTYFDCVSDNYNNFMDKMNFAYPYISNDIIPSNMTVTELKRRAIETEQIYSPFEDVVLSKPKLFGGSSAIFGAGYGTLVHFVMENLDFSSILNTTDIVEQLNLMQEKKLISVEEKNSINCEKIYKFINSSLGQRMTQNSVNLKKEFSFKYLEKAKKIFDTQSEDEFVIQGTVDAYFTDSDDKIVIVDYKTDKVIDGNIDIIVERYHSQLDYYANALNKITGKHVKEKYLYLFDIDEAIQI